MDEKQI